MKPAWRSSPHPRQGSAFARQRPDAGLAHRVLSAGPAAPGIPGNEKFIDVSLPRQGLVATLTLEQGSRLISELAAGMHAARRDIIARHVELGYALSRIKAKLGHGRYLGWLAGSSVHERLAQRAVALWEAFGDDCGQVDVGRVVQTLRDFGPPKFAGASVNTLDHADLNLRMLTRAAARAQAERRAAESVVMQGGEVALVKSDTVSDLKADARAAELHEISLSSSAGSGDGPRSGCLTPPRAGHGAGPLHSAGGGAPNLSVGVGGGAVTGFVPRADTPIPGSRPRGADVVVRPGGAGGGGEQLTLQRRYELAEKARRVAAILDGDGVRADKLALVESGIDMALKAAEWDKTVRVVGVVPGSAGSGGAVGAAAPTSRT